MLLPPYRTASIPAPWLPRGFDSDPAAALRLGFWWCGIRAASWLHVSGLLRGLHLGQCPRSAIPMQRRRCDIGFGCRCRPCDCRAALGRGCGCRSAPVCGCRTHAHARARTHARTHTTGGGCSDIAAGLLRSAQIALCLLSQSAGLRLPCRPRLTKDGTAVILRIAVGFWLVRFWFSIFDIVARLHGADQGLHV